jgi:hypothetical protein
MQIFAVEPLTGFGVCLVAGFSIDIDALRVGCQKCGVKGKKILPGFNQNKNLYFPRFP